MEFGGFGVMLTISGIMATIGYLIGNKKAYFLISGYNTMQAEKKGKVDIEGLGAATARLCYLLSGLFAISSIPALSGKPWLMMFCIFLMFPIIGYFLIRVQRFDGNAVKPDGGYRTSTKIIVGSVIGLLGVLAVLMGSAMYSSGKPSGIVMDGNGLTVKGSFGTRIPSRDIERVRLVDSMPEILARTNGSALGYVRKGHFDVAGIGSARLYLADDSGPYIRIDSRQGVLFMNAGSPHGTKEIYRRISEYTGK